MYGIELTIRPTGGLTFRRMPSAILHISTYPFLPPTTMSGWLRRLFMLSQGADRPTVDHLPATAVKKPSYFILDHSYKVLGGYPPAPFEGKIHTTKRHGPMFQSKHSVFSRLYRNKSDEGNAEKLQLHTWEYFIVDRLRGFVLHDRPEPLARFSAIVNYGCKIGKEGYAFLESVSEVKKLELMQGIKRPDTLVLGDDLIGESGTLYPLYRHRYSKKGEQTLDPASNKATDVDGFIPFWGGWADDPINLSYWTDGRADGSWTLPERFVEALYATE